MRHRQQAVAGATFTCHLHEPLAEARAVGLPGRWCPHLLDKAIDVT